MSEPAIVLPDLDKDPGNALIRVPGAAAGAADPRFRLTRDGYEDNVLGPAGWQVADTLLTPLASRVDGADLVLSVGPDIVDRVESGVIVLAVPAAGYDAPLFWPDLPLSRAGATPPPSDPPRPPPVPPDPPPPPVVEPVKPPDPPKPPVMDPPKPIVVDPPKPVDPVKPDPTPNRLPYILGGVAAVILLAGGAWYALRPAPPAVPPPGRTEPPPQQTARDCGQGSVADMVACAADAAGLYAVAQRKWEGGQADQGLVLMQIAADRGSGPAALKLAQLYDPNGFQPGGPIPQPNARQAALYYRKAVQAHQDAATGPREALHQRLQRDAENGDTLAGLTVKDYWP